VKLKPITLVGGFCLLLILGCARNDDANSQSGAPTTQPASQASAKISPTVAINPAPTTRPSGSVLVVDRAEFFFPTARMRLAQQNGRVVVRLYSDGPSPDSAGTPALNTYDLVMTMPASIHQFSDLPGAIWTSESVSMEKQDSPYGIFLDNQRDILQPLNVRVEFGGQMPYLTVYLHGTFARFHSAEDEPASAPMQVRVKGLLNATLDGTK
jgi:hypothetical protein